jgi:hypothetical protein
VIVSPAPNSEYATKRQCLLNPRFPTVPRATIALAPPSQDGLSMNVSATTVLAQLATTAQQEMTRFGLQPRPRLTRRLAQMEHTAHRLELGLLPSACLALQVGCAPPQVPWVASLPRALSAKMDSDASTASPAFHAPRPASIAHLSLTKSCSAR